MGRAERARKMGAVPHRRSRCRGHSASLTVAVAAAHLAVEEEASGSVPLDSVQKHCWRVLKENRCRYVSLLLRVAGADRRKKQGADRRKDLAVLAV
ncbi:hypothetical protein MRB53_023367 [Persea americana]|uniref:Uncharacterized protein n=1 Tax=Persea americana TaxID=3435 RepID=A0ACC2LAH2_PERAE|nr:hypothetical protein MRB53_023367 [Persea americana]